MKVEFLELAYREYKQAIDFYNMQSEDLGNKFITEINKTISIIKNYPDSFSEYTKHTRKAIVHIFPYNIIYSFQNEILTIIAIAHQHRKPITG